MKRNYYILFILITLLSYLGCEKDSGSPELEIKMNDPTEILETSFTASWEMNSTDFDSLIIEVSCTEDFNQLVSHKTITEKGKSSQVVDGLNGNTLHYYRMVVWKSAGIIYTTLPEKVSTICTIESIRFKTSDNYELVGSVSYLESGRTKKPGIIFMHEFAYKAEFYVYEIQGWQDSEVMNEFIASDYVCMFFYFRGHGTSQDFDIYQLSPDPELLTRDLKAAIEYLQSHERVQPDSIALLGASMGSRVATLGNCLDGVKASVAVSYHQKIPFDYNCPGTKPKNILIIAGENEYVSVLDLDNIDWAAEALTLYNKCDEPKKLHIEPGAVEHGTNLLKYPDVNKEITDWIKAFL